MTSYKPKKIDLDEHGLAMVLGELESEILDCIWAHEHYTVRNICDCLNMNRAISFNALNTVINRMVKKGLLEKKKDDSYYYYMPTVSEDDFRKKVSKQVFSSLLKDDRMFGYEALAEYIQSLPESQKKKLQGLL